MSHSSASSDDEAPESFSFNKSKKTVEGEARALQKFYADEKQRLKEKRRQKDRALKERKTLAKGKGKAKEMVLKEGDEEDNEEPASPSKEDLEARMERAMREAQEEFGEDDEGEGEDFDMSGQQNDEDEGSERDDENDTESEDEDDEPIQSEPMKKKDYLPEHLFASAFSQLSSEDEPKAKARSKKRAASPPTKRKRVKTSTKEIVVGSRVVRTLPSLANHPSTTTPKGFAPPRALKKFVDRSLNVRGRAKDAKLRGWERRPANIGVMKRNGPAAHFVRDD